MKVETDNFASLSNALSREPLYAISLSFDENSTDLIWLTSNSDTQLPSGTLPADIIHGAINKGGISGKTQSIDHSTAESSIGSVTVKVTDSNRELSQRIHDKLGTDQSLRHKKLRIYLGFQGLVWGDYSQVLTFIINKVGYKNGTYTLQCNDIQREVKKDIFPKHVSSLASTITAANTTIPLNNVNPNLFPTLFHGSNFTFDPNEGVSYIKIKNEIIKHYGANSSGNALEGVVRGALGTEAAEYTIDASTKIEIEEYIAFEGNAIQWLYALHTGILPDGKNLLNDVFDLTTNEWGMNNGVISESTEPTPYGWGKMYDVEDTNISAQGHSYQFQDEYTYIDGDVITASAIVKHDDANSDRCSCRLRFSGTVVYCYAEIQLTMSTGVITPYSSSNATIVSSNGVKIGDYWFLKVTAYCTSGDSAAVGHTFLAKLTPANTGVVTICAPFLGKGETDGWSFIPAHWHLGINEDYIDITDFYEVPPAVWDAENSTGKNVRFWNLDKESGKKFISSEFLVWLGAVMPVHSNGKLGFTKRGSALPRSSYTALVTDADIISYGELVYNYDQVINNIAIHWNWLRSQEKFSKITQIIDSESIVKYGKSPLKEIKLRGIVTGSHAEEELLQYFDSIRDSHIAPPVTLSLTVTGKWARADVADRIRVASSHIFDHNDNAALDRAFEIQSTKIDWLRGKVTLNLFGGVEKSSLIRLTSNAKLLDSYYTHTSVYEHDIATLPGVSITGGVLNSDHTFVGDVDRASLAIYFHDGDLEIASTITLTNNVTIRCSGHLHITGTIDGVGGGKLGGAGQTASNSSINFGVNGAFGKPHSGGGLYLETLVTSLNNSDVTAQPLSSGDYAYGYYPWSRVGEELAFPELQNRTGATLYGLPYSLTGSGGAGGQASFHYLRNWTAALIEVSSCDGGDGGVGGAGLIIISRGLSFDGVSGNINLSGSDGQAGGSVNAALDYVAGAGAGGWPGACLLVLDGALIAPDRDYIIQNNGATPLNLLAEQGIATKTTVHDGIVYYNDKIGDQQADRSNTLLEIISIPAPELYELFTERQMQEQAAKDSTIPSDNVDQLWDDISGANKPIDNANFVDNTNQLTDGAGLGNTADWANVALTANAPDNNATENQSDATTNAGINAAAVTADWANVALTVDAPDSNAQVNTINAGDGLAALDSGQNIKLNDIAPGATQNNGDLADLNVVDTPQIAANAVTADVITTGASAINHTITAGVSSTTTLLSIGLPSTVTSGTTVEINAEVLFNSSQFSFSALGSQRYVNFVLMIKRNGAVSKQVSLTHRQLPGDSALTVTPINFPVCFSSVRGAGTNLSTDTITLEVYSFVPTGGVPSSATLQISYPVLKIKLFQR